MKRRSRAKTNSISLFLFSDLGFLGTNRSTLLQHSLKIAALKRFTQKTIHSTEDGLVHWFHSDMGKQSPGARLSSLRNSERFPPRPKARMICIQWCDVSRSAAQNWLNCDLLRFPASPRQPALPDPVHTTSATWFIGYSPWWRHITYLYFHEFVYFSPWWRQIHKYLIPRFCTTSTFLFIHSFRRKCEMGAAVTEIPI